ncbi:MAG TPA: HD domain-containing phosphohydrolase, partial [Dehalococcoidia bacterium]|nr:HD domain-containing phosphohydrolase [Dehalococcoidia bacterium]
EAIALSARLVLLAQSVGPAFMAGGVQAATAVARQRAGHALDPRLVRRFCAEARRILPEAVREPVWERALAAEPGRPLWLSDGGIETAVRAIADFTDLAAPVLAGHCSGVGDLAAEAGRRCGLGAETLTDLRRAGYLHDLGRVGLSAGLWQKPAALSAGEWERVRLHPYYTERILARAPGLSRAGAIAALHHERLDGSGYHRAAPAATQPPAARILAAADAYHAMTEPRPYRAALSPEEAAGTLQRGVREGRFDGEAVRGVLAAAGHRVQQTRRSYPAGLSEREVEVLRLLAHGCSNKQIGAALAISAKTAGHHVQHIYDKAGVSTRAAATLFAMQHDLLDTLAPPGSQ